MRSVLINRSNYRYYFYSIHTERKTNVAVVHSLLRFLVDVVLLKTEKKQGECR